MSTDRELLENAAKAAGYELVWGDKYKLGDDEIDCTDIPYIRSGQPDEGDVHWNPLADDGDALRLAVKLRIDITHFTTGVRADVTGYDDCYQPNDNDPLAATRRAIVRAAAEIGRSKT
jgi:hypothetical protein